MANVHQEQLSEDVRILTFVDKKHGILFCLKRGCDNLRVCELNFIKGEVLSKETTWSKTMVTQNMLPPICLSKDSGILEMKTPLGFYFVFTKENLKTLTEFLKS